jgi:hypothetical protein
LVARPCYPQGHCHYSYFAKSWKESVSTRCRRSTHSLTEKRAGKKKLVPSPLVLLKDCEMSDGKDYVKEKEDGRHWNIRYDVWYASQTVSARRIWRTLWHRWALPLCTVSIQPSMKDMYQPGGHLGRRFQTLSLSSFQQHSVQIIRGQSRVYEAAGWLLHISAHPSARQHQVGPGRAWVRLP